MASHGSSLITLSTNDRSTQRETNYRRHKSNSDITKTPPTPTSIGQYDRMSMTRNGHKYSIGPSQNKSWKRRHTFSFHEFKHFVIHKTWMIPLLLLLTIITLDVINSTPSNPLHPLTFLSYEQASASSSPSHQYGKGPRDLLFVISYTLFLTFTREFITQELLYPLSIQLHIPPKKRLRFMEQSYTALYFSITGPLGLYIMSRTPLWYFNTAAMYTTYPHLTHDALFKTYYLLQAAYWAQQAIVMILGLEAPRSDFKELVIHHIVTLSLIGLSYTFHFTWMGLGVFITHDISDFFLALSKSLHYANSPYMPLQFAITITTWIYTRHYLNLRILWSVATEFKTIGPYALDWETQEYKCEISRVVVLGLLGVLQVLNLGWLGCLGRSVWRYVSKGEVRDERSGDEDE